MARQPTFAVVELPKPLTDAEYDSKWIALAEKYRKLRLRSLKVAPEAFASSYEIESQRGLDQTFERLKNPKARQFVAVDDSSTETPGIAGDVDVRELCKREWVGMVVILGPMEEEIHAREDPYRQMHQTHQNARVATESDVSSRSLQSKEFVLNGVFVEPSVRRKGVGSALIEAAVESVRNQDTAQDYELAMTTLVNVENSGARKLYEKAGFGALGEETYRQNPRALLGESEVMVKRVLKMRKIVSLD